jgi:hypothetical protein
MEVDGGAEKLDVHGNVREGEIVRSTGRGWI